MLYDLFMILYGLNKIDNHVAHEDFTQIIQMFVNSHIHGSLCELRTKDHSEYISKVYGSMICIKVQFLTNFL